MKSARPRRQALGRAARSDTSSTINTGTASPTAASQSRPGTKNAMTRNGAGANTSQPMSQAASSRGSDGDASSTTAHAQTKGALRSAADNVSASKSCTWRATFLNTKEIAAAGTPKARQAQKCAP